MNTHDTGDDPTERDPTGIRAILSSLPDPGPMPADLVARITASLEQERAAGNVVPFGAARTPAEETRESWSHADRRPAHRRVQWLAAAAAVAVLASLGGTALVNDRFGSWTAMFSGSRSAGSTAMAAASTSSAGDAKAAAGGLAPGSAVLVYFSNHRYAASTLGKDAAGLLLRPGPELAPLAAESPSIGPIGTPLGARDCATSVGVPAELPLRADLGTYDGQPAVVLVSGATGAASAYVVSRSCVLLAGPVVVP